MKLALGTVQFGLDYGISNQSGKVKDNEVAKILQTAQDNQILTLDTASAYGNSEKVLGNALPKLNETFKVIDKIPDLESHKLSIEKTLHHSLESLGLTQIEGLLLHNAADLTDKNYKQLQSLKSQGLVNKIGISVYNPHQTFELSERYALDLVQLPMNLFDQRFAETGCIEHLKNLNVEVHARSIFLQGLLLMKCHQLSSYFAPYHVLFERIDELCKELDVDRQVVALNMAHRQPLVDKFVIGVCTQTQLEQVVLAYEQARNIRFDIERFNCHEEALYFRNNYFCSRNCIFYKCLCRRRRGSWKSKVQSMRCLSWSKWRR